MKSSAEQEAREALLALFEDSCHHNGGSLRAAEYEVLEKVIARVSKSELEKAAQAALSCHILKAVAHYSGDGWKDTIKAGDVAFVWNRQLPPPYAPGQYPRIDNGVWAVSDEQFDLSPATPDEVTTYLERTRDDLRKLSRAHEASAAEIERLRCALRAAEEDFKHIRMGANNSATQNNAGNAEDRVRAALLRSTTTPESKS